MEDLFIGREYEFISYYFGMEELYTSNKDSRHYLGTLSNGLTMVLNQPNGIYLSTKLTPEQC